MTQADETATAPASPVEPLPPAPVVGFDDSVPMVTIRRPRVPPVAVLGYAFAAALAVVVYTWFAVQFNDAHYEGVIETSCDYVWDDHGNIIGRELVIITNERKNVQRLLTIPCDCSMNP